ncbi:HD-GYP domain-containing protein [Xylanibacillus composti]|nr:HD-GYP domain-containing protein [Xylanibacillus composti]MDT9724766.1 HD-GYP domain-containing protein [Xylanibacillus composti]
MRLIAIQQCRPGMTLARNIYNESGLVLLGTGVELTDTLIRRLSETGIDFIYIADSRTEDVVIPELLDDDTRIQSLEVIRSSFKTLMEENHRKRYSGHKELGKNFRQVTTMIMDDLSRHPDALIMLSHMQALDHYLFSHSMNVCVYATMLGMSQGLSKDELYQLSLGALLHDIGKTSIPQAILQKPGSLTAEEMEIMQRHAEIGYYMLKDEPNIPLLSAHCAFQHHERLDGSGYPRGITSEDIHDYAKILGIVDSYDAMTSNRVYRKALLPHQAVEILYSGAGSQFDLKQLSLFRDKVAIYPIGLPVVINTGERGIVVDLNPKVPHRPVVRILEDPEGQMLPAPYELDLSHHHNIVITDIESGSPTGTEQKSVRV